MIFSSLELSTYVYPGSEEFVKQEAEKLRPNSSHLLYTPAKHLFAQLYAEESLGDFFTELSKAREAYNKVKHLW